MNKTCATIHAVHTGRPQLHEEPDPWVTAIVKTPVSGPVTLTEYGLLGDDHADLVNHGGPDKAVCAYAFDHYPFWMAQLKRDTLHTGAFGENLTIAGVVDAVACIGDVMMVGTATVQISQPRQPCWKLARLWRIEDFAQQVVRANRTGWYFRVIRGGTIEAGDPLALVERPHPEWTIAAANDVMHRGGHDPEASAALAAVPALSLAWKRALERRLDR